MTFKTRLVFIAVAVFMIVLTILMSGRFRSSDQTGLKAAFNAEFLVRPDGYQGLSKHYDFRFPENPLQMDSGLMYRAVADGNVDVICGFATDGRIQAYNLVMLEDDKKFFPPYFAAPLVREEALTRFPQLAEILELLKGKIDDRTMQGLNYRVDEERATPARVARDFLLSQNLIKKSATQGSGADGTLVVASKEFTEQEILGEIIATLIESLSEIRVERKLNLGGTMICFNALKSGDIDMYAEYTGTGLVTILKDDVIQDPQQAYDLVKEKFSQKYGLIWLSPLGFNNTYTLTMRKTQAQKLGITTISELAALVKKERQERQDAR